MLPQESGILDLRKSSRYRAAALPADSVTFSPKWAKEVGASAARALRVGERLGVKGSGGGACRVWRRTANAEPKAAEAQARVRRQPTQSGAGGKLGRGVRHGAREKPQQTPPLVCLYPPLVYRLPLPN